jgi:hypothetical protein
VPEQPSPFRDRRTRLSAIRVAGLDLVGPLVVYRLCRTAGLPAVWSLVVSGATPALGVIIDYARWRTLEVVALVVLAGIGFSVAAALISGSTKAVLLEGAAGTAGFGVLCMLSLGRARPLLFYFIQAFFGGRHSEVGQWFDQSYVGSQAARRYFRIVTVVWGIVYFFEAGILAVIVQVASTGTSLVFNRTVPWVGGIPLFIWTYRWGQRLRREGETLEEGTA